MNIPGVDAVFVVALKSRPDRLAPLAAELKDQQIGFEIFDAFDARLLKFRTDVVSSMADLDGRALSVSPGRLGCFLSKVALLRECHRRRVGNVLVLEDDAAIVPDFRERFTRAVASLSKSGWDALYCGCWDWRPETARPFDSEIYRPGRAMLTHAVLYSAGVLAALIDETRELHDTLDLQLSTRLNPRLSIFATTAEIARQRNPGESHA